MNCLFPFRIRGDDDRDIIVPCGHCYNCLSRLRNEWCIRLKAEYLDSKLSFFITLTYDDDNLPIGDYVCEETGECIKKPYPRKRDIQLFMKSLRKKYNSKFRYFAVSEYGEVTKRPHWHMLLFTQYDKLPFDFYDNIVNIWSRGIVQFGDITDASINYCTKYVLKDAEFPYNINDTSRLISKRPAIGYNVIMSQLRSFNIPNCTIDNFMLRGQRGIVPKLFRQKMYALMSDDEAGQLKFDIMQRSFEKKVEKFNKSKFDNYEDYLNSLRLSFNRKTEIITNHFKPHIKV